MRFSSMSKPVTYGHHVQLAGNAGLDPERFYVNVEIGRASCRERVS
jgi:hypothetical protein